LRATATRDGEQLKVGADELHFRVTSADSDGALLAFEIRMPPGGGPPALHRHDPAELYRIEHGEFAFYIGDIAALAAAHGIEITRPLEAIR
jgi:hypothetical protein